MVKSSPFVLAPDLDADTALTLIEQIIGTVRKNLSIPRTAQTRASDTGTADDREPRARRAHHVERREVHTQPTTKTPRPRTGPRVVYSVVPVKNGKTLQLRNPTEGMMKVVDFLRTAGKSTIPQIMEGTGLKMQTVHNLTSELTKQKALEKSTPDASS